MEKLDIYTVLYPTDKAYPKALKEIAKPPEQLYCLGDISMLKKRSIAIVGSRKISSYGRWVAEALSEKISRYDVTVISGMARGIDTHAHIGALKGMGSTIAVLGCGIDKCYPAENWRLKDRIAQQGLVISEYPPGMSASRWTFPQRNRIISALSEIVVVAEAGLNSGALITAELAVEQGKTVMAVPGNINNSYNIGSNKLIADGVVPVTVLDDVTTMLGIDSVEDIDSINLGDEEKMVMEVVKNMGEISVDEISKATDMTISHINGLVTVLEMKGYLQTSLGKVFIAK